MTKDRLKELLGVLSRDDDTPERIDAMNSILDEYEDTGIEAKLKEAEDKYSALEQRYRDTFKEKLSANDSVEVKEKTEVEEEKQEDTTTFEDIFSDVEENK